jgi:hypothetical protein
LWRKAKWLNRQEFVIVGWSDPEGTRPHLGALLLGYYTDDGKLAYSGRVGTGECLTKSSPISGAGAACRGYLEKALKYKKRHNHARALCVYV